MLRRLNLTIARFVAVSLALALALTLQQTPRLQAQTTGCGQPTPGFPSVVTCAGPGAYTWTVPDNVTQVTFDVFGAQGGCVANQQGLSGDLATCSQRAENLPGKGGEAKATLSVHLHDVFQINVGGAGKDAPYPSQYLTSPPVGLGGFNGGGQASAGGGGGGASDVRTGAFTLNDRVIVAGGGGGGHANPGTYGGAGGGATGGIGSAFTCWRLNLNSTSCDTAQERLTAGAGGAASAGGAAGSAYEQLAGQSGSFGLGGNGNGGGGGGSGYAIPSATNASLTSGVQAGDGRVTITYQSISPFCPTSVSQPFSSVCPAAGAAAGNPGQAEITSAEPATNGPAASGPGSNSLGIQATPNTASGLQGCSGSLGNAIPCNGGGPTAGPGTAAGNPPSGPQVCFDTFGDQIPCASGAGVGSPFGGGGNLFSPFGP